MKIKRVLEHDDKEIELIADGKRLVITHSGKSTDESFESDTDAVERLLDLTRTKIGQGWTPKAKPSELVRFIADLEKLDVSMWRWIASLGDAEVAAAYEAAIARDTADDVSLDVLRRRPRRELLAWMLTHFGDYYEEDWTKAIKFLSKEPEQAAWINEELQRALAENTLPTERAKKFAQRNSKKIAAGPKPKPVAPASPVGNEASLLDLIARSPKDDAPRLVYADWLLERGLGWGEYIQLSCQIAPLEYEDPKFDSLNDRLEKLERKHAKAWLEPIRPFIRSWSFERGLLARVVCDAALFIQAADAIALRAPRAYIELTALKKKDMAALAKTPLGAFDSVNLGSQRIDDEQMATLARSPSIAGVSTWSLGYNPFGDVGLIAIAASPHFSSVDTIDVRASHAPFGAQAFAALIASKTFPKLRSLDIEIVSAKAAFANAAVALESLSLGAMTFTNADASDLVKAKSLRGLRHLSIQQSGNQALELDDDGVNVLLSKLALQSFATSARVSATTRARIEKLSNA